MDKKKIRKLERQGWKVGEARDFLGLSEQESALVEMPLALSKKTRELRHKRGLTQVDVAKLLDSSQSRVAKIEAGDNSVSLDLQIRSMLTLGATKEEVAEAIAG